MEKMPRDKTTKLLEQVLILEDEMEKLIRENNLLKEHLSRENTALGTQIVDNLSGKIELATSAVLSQIEDFYTQICKQTNNTNNTVPINNAPLNTALPNTPTSPSPSSPSPSQSLQTILFMQSSLHNLRTYTNDMCMLFCDLEQEVKFLWEYSKDLTGKLHEKEKHLQIYAAVNEKLTQIKEDYMRIKKGSANIEQ
ncbi:hypothetical protein NECID01_1367 [Nematocida sp. AWRm77]|nr:hypothetical protein NECID01_1367 [Nematocida sp. AWRm77]